MVNPSIREVNKETEHHVEIINEFRKNRKVTTIEFEIKKISPPLKTIKGIEKISKNVTNNNDLDSWLNSNEEDKLIEDLAKIGIGASACVKLTTEYGFESVKKCLELTLKDHQDGKFNETTRLAGIVINRLRDPKIDNLSLTSTKEELSEIRAKMMSWIESENINYEMYRFEEKWVGIDINGKIVNFMDKEFKDKVMKIVSSSKTSNKQD